MAAGNGGDAGWFVLGAARTIVVMGAAGILVATATWTGRTMVETREDIASIKTELVSIHGEVDELMRLHMRNTNLIIPTKIVK